MKCKYCNGTGTSNTCVNGTFKPCSFCDGTGEYEPFDADIELDKLDSEPQTNEEWLRSATTEQLAEWIYQERWTHSDGWYELCGHTVKEVVEWLKQPHTTE